MRLLAAFLALFLTGCSTTIYYPNGKKKFRTYADSRAISFEDMDTRFQAGELNHSTPTKAAAGGVTSAITAAGAAGIGGLK